MIERPTQDELDLEQALNIKRQLHISADNLKQTLQDRPGLLKHLEKMNIKEEVQSFVHEWSGSIIVKQ